MRRFPTIFFDIFDINVSFIQTCTQILSDPSDRRATLVQFSERGWLAHQVARAAVQGVQEEWTQVIGKAEMEAFLATLARLADLATEAETTARNNVQHTVRFRGRRSVGQ